MVIIIIVIVLIIIIIVIILIIIVITVVIVVVTDECTPTRQLQPRQPLPAQTHQHHHEHNCFQPIPADVSSSGDDNNRWLMAMMRMMTLIVIVMMMVNDGDECSQNLPSQHLQAVQRCPELPLEDRELQEDSAHRAVKPLPPASDPVLLQCGQDPKECDLCRNGRCSPLGRSSLVDGLGLSREEGFVCREGGRRISAPAPQGLSRPLHGGLKKLELVCGADHPQVSRRQPRNCWRDHGTEVGMRSS